MIMNLTCPSGAKGLQPVDALRLQPAGGEIELAFRVDAPARCQAGLEPRQQPLQPPFPVGRIQQDQVVAPGGREERVN